MVKKGHKYVTLSQINVPRVMIMSQKLGKFIWHMGTFIGQWGTFRYGGSIIWDEMEGHLFDKKGHLFWEGSQFWCKLLGGRNVDHVYEPSGFLAPKVSSQQSLKERCYYDTLAVGHNKLWQGSDQTFHHLVAQDPWIDVSVQQKLADRRISRL